MYKLLIDGADCTTENECENLDDAQYWYKRAFVLGASSMALWCDKVLLKFYIKNSPYTDLTLFDYMEAGNEQVG